MIYSRLFLNAHSNQVMHEIGNLYELHRSLMSAFPDDNSREKAAMLFRVDQYNLHGNGKIPILVQSEIKPDWHAIEQRCNYLHNHTVETKEFVIPEKLPDIYRFMIRANPTIRKSDSRKLIPLQKEEQLIEWLRKKGQQHGFSISPENLIIRKIPPLEMYKTINNKRNHIQIQPVDFSGLITITDQRLFTDAWKTGIGRGKAFGCGLLSMARA